MRFGSKGCTNGLVFCLRQPLHKVLFQTLSETVWSILSLKYPLNIGSWRKKCEHQPPLAGKGCTKWLLCSHAPHPLDNISNIVKNSDEVNTVFKRQLEYWIVKKVNIGRHPQARVEPSKSWFTGCRTLFEHFHLQTSSKTAYTAFKRPLRGAIKIFFFGKSWAFGPTSGPPPPPCKLGRQKKKKKLNVYFAF